MRPANNPVAIALLRALTAVGGLSGNDREKPMIVLEFADYTDWASATFVGATHTLVMRITGHAAGVDAAVAAIQLAAPDHEFAIPGHIVAEIAILPVATDVIADGMVSKSLTVNALVIHD